MNVSNLEVTVCICTYNRARSLAMTLNSLRVSLPVLDFNWELLVVDNNSKDDTKDLTCGFMDRLPARYVHESKQGLSNARNRAMRECRGDLLVFTDDDVEFSPDWLRQFVNAARSFSDVDYFGGRILLRWQNGRPSWVRDEGMPLLGGLFGYYDLGTDTRRYEPADLGPCGANFALRRRLFEYVGSFRTDLGVSGPIPGRGEETEYLGRARNQGFGGVYVGSAVCYHRVDPNNLRLSYLYRFGVQKGIAEVRIKPDCDLKGSYARELMFALKGLFQLGKGKGDRFRQCVINMGIQAGLRRASKGNRLAS